jgi:uncharacterized membrane protein
LAKNESRYVTWSQT